MCLFSNTRRKQTASAKTVQLISVEDLKSQGHIECTPFGTLPSHSICGQQFKQNTEGTGRNSRQAKLCCLCASRFWNQLVQSPTPPCSAHAPLVTCFPSLSRVSAHASHARAPAGRTHQRVPLPGRPRSLRGFFLGQTCHPFSGLSSTCPLHLKDK